MPPAPDDRTLTQRSPVNAANWAEFAARSGVETVVADNCRALCSAYGSHGPTSDGSRRGLLRQGLIGIIAASSLAACSATESTKPTSTSEPATNTIAAVDPAGCPASPDTGVSATEIVVGHSSPQTGQFAIYSGVRRGIESYFSLVNSKGGIRGHKLRLIAYDDQMSVAGTRNNVQRLIENDGVFALVGVWGTDNNLAIRELVNRACVPNLAMGTGSALFSADDRYQWETEGLLADKSALDALAKFMSSNMSRAQLGIVVDDGEDGSAQAKAMIEAADRYGVDYVAPERFNPIEELDAAQQVRRLADAGADVVVVDVGGKSCPSTLALVDVDVQLVVPQLCAPGVVMGQVTHDGKAVWTVRSSIDPNAQPFQNELQPVTEFVGAVAPTDRAGPAVRDGIEAIGWNQAAIFVAALSAAPALDRVSVMDAARHLGGDEPVRTGLIAGDFELNGSGAPAQTVTVGVVREWSDPAWVVPQVKG